MVCLMSYLTVFGILMVFHINDNFILSHRMKKLKHKIIVDIILCVNSFISLPTKKKKKKYTQIQSE